MKRVTLLVVLWLVLLPSLARSTTWYVATGGNNSNPGTIGSPFLTIAKGLSVMAAGDILYIRGGTYTATIDSSVQAPPSGSSFANAPLIAGYPGETVILRPQSNRAGIGIADGVTHHVIFDNFVIDGTDSSGAEMVTLIDAHHIRIQNSEVKNGIAQGMSSYGVGHHNEFINIEVHHNGTDFFHQGIYIKNPDNLVDGCYFHDNVAFGVQVFTSGSGYNNSRNIIRNNRIANNGITNGGSGITVWEGEDIQIYNNVVWGNGTGISLGRTLNNTQVYHNTVYNNGDGITTNYNTSLNSLIRNNIVYLSGDIHDVVGGVGTVQDHNLVATNPLFVNAGASDFHLQSGSPARDTGVTLGSVTTDRDGVARPQGSAVDIGAYEFGDIASGATKVAFSTQPVATPEGQALALVVAQIQDASSVLVPGATTPITVAIGTNPASGTLAGTLTRTPLLGQASFPNLSLDRAGVGYTLLGSASGLTTGTSSAFPVTMPPTLPWVAQETKQLLCAVLGGGTNASNVGAGSDFPHTVACVLPPGALQAQSQCKVCGLFALHTGGTTQPLHVKLTTATTIIGANSAPPPPPGTTLATAWTCWLLASTAAPGASVPVVVAFEDHYPEGGLLYASETTTVTQPVTLATNAPLTLSLLSHWDGAGSGDNTLALLALLVEVQR
jgi:hypothetical protein